MPCSYVRWLASNVVDWKNKGILESRSDGWIRCPESSST